MEPENTAGSARRRDGGCQSGDPCLLWGKSPRPRTKTGEKGPFPAAERQARGANEPAKTNNTPSQEPAQFLSLHSCLGGHELPRHAVALLGATAADLGAAPHHAVVFQALAALGTAVAHLGA